MIPEREVMSTLRLRTIQQPTHVERLLEALVTHQGLVTSDWYRIRDPDSLPPQLQLLLRRETKDGRTWACWANNGDAMLFTCEPSLPWSTSRRTSIVLHVNRYDKDGALREAGFWKPVSHGDWQRCRM
jgi:hypothetical protein